MMSKEVRDRYGIGLWRTIRRLSILESPSLWAMRGGSSFRRINSVMMSLCVFLFPFYLP